MNSDAITELFATAKMQRPEDAIGCLLWRVAHRHQREMDRAMADIDLTHLQFVALVQTAWLGRDGATVTQPDLAALSNIHPMQLSNLLKALAEKSLIERPRSPTDSRIKLVVLTTAGIAALTAAMPRASAHQQRFFDDVPKASPLREALRQIVASWGDDP
jgi:DNA-binding MarR family transcriptional regulator